MKAYLDRLVACPTASRATSNTSCTRSIQPRAGNAGLIDRITRWIARGSVALVGATLCGAAIAQVPPILLIDDASIFEGNAGANPILKLAVHFVGAQPNTVTGLVSAAPLVGTGFNPATGAAACGAAGVDFEQFANVPFSIPPNTPNGTLSVNIRLCGDATIEPDQHIFVSLTSVVGAQCLEGTCIGVGTIVNDDGPPAMAINNISVSEPISGTRTVSFTVSLHHPSSQPISVRFATRDGTAHAPCLPPCAFSPDYNVASGTLNIPANSPSGSINVTIRGDGARENDETFFVDLSAPVNATILDGTGQATIRDTSLSIGSFDLDPDNAVVMLDEFINYTVIWTVPEGQVWRDLQWIDLRIRGPHKPLWLRWDEAANTFSLCQKGNGPNNDDEDDSEDDDATNSPGEGGGQPCSALRGAYRAPQATSRRPRRASIWPKAASPAADRRVFR